VLGEGLKKRVSIVTTNHRTGVESIEHPSPKCHQKKRMFGTQVGTKNRGPNGIGNTKVAIEKSKRPGYDEAARTEGTFHQNHNAFI